MCVCNTSQASLFVSTERLQIAALRVSQDRTIAMIDRYITFVSSCLLLLRYGEYGSYAERQFAEVFSDSRPA